MNPIMPVGALTSAPVTQVSMALGGDSVSASPSAQSVNAFEKMVGPEAAEQSAKPEAASDPSGSAKPASWESAMQTEAYSAFSEMRQSLGSINHNLFTSQGTSQEFGPMYLLAMQKNIMFASISVELYSKIANVVTQDIQTLFKNQ